MLRNERADPTLEVAVDGWSVNIANMSELMGCIVAQLRSSASSFMVCTLNLDHLVKLRRNAEFRNAYARAEFVTADGFPIATLGRLSGSRLERTAGSDLIEPVCKIAAQYDFPIFLVGSTLAVLSASASLLVANYPGLDIRGAFAPPRGFDPTSRLADEIIEIVRCSGARICFVALGAPRQEIFGARAIEKTSGVCFLPIGAGLDFLAGTQTRSPRLLRYLKLEWAWRLAHDPIGLIGRYRRCSFLFFELLLSHYCFPRPRRTHNA